MKIRNNKGPNTDPCGTPLDAPFVSENSFHTFTLSMMAAAE